MTANRSHRISPAGSSKRAGTPPIESERPDEPSSSFLQRIGAPGLADIELDGSLPASLPREVDLD